MITGNLHFFLFFKRVRARDGQEKPPRLEVIFEGFGPQAA